MALAVKDRVRETSTTSGTGTLTLAGAVVGFQAFSVIGNANTTYYGIVDATTGDFEVGIGTYTLSGTTLSRTTVLSSSNANSLVNFAANSKDVFVTYPSSKSIYLDASGNVIGLGTPAAFVATNVTGLPLTTGVTGTLPVANGGTGVTSSTGTGNTVLSASPTFTGTLAAAIGTFSSTLSTSGDATIAGHTVGRGAASVASNLVVGSGSLTATTSGSADNTVIGASSGTTLTTGDGNVIIGGSNSASSATVNYETVIGFAGTGKGTTTFFACTNGGGAFQSNNATTWTQTSDRRLKKNIVDNNVGLDKITALQIRNFEYRLPEEVDELEAHCAIDVKGIQVGVISQEIQQVLPDCVKTESTGVMSVDSTNLTFYLVNAVKELKSIIDTQAARITALENA